MEERWHSGEVGRAESALRDVAGSVVGLIGKRQADWFKGMKLS